MFPRFHMFIIAIASGLYNCLYRYVHCYMAVCYIRCIMCTSNMFLFLYHLVSRRLNITLALQWHQQRFDCGVAPWLGCGQLQLAMRRKPCEVLCGARRVAEAMPRREMLQNLPRPCPGIGRCCRDCDALMASTAIAIILCCRSLVVV